MVTALGFVEVIENVGRMVEALGVAVTAITVVVSLGRSAAGLATRSESSVAYERARTMSGEEFCSAWRYSSPATSSAPGNGPHDHLGRDSRCGGSHPNVPDDHHPDRGHSGAHTRGDLTTWSNAASD